VPELDPPLRGRDQRVRHRIDRRHRQGHPSAEQQERLSSTRHRPGRQDRPAEGQDIAEVPLAPISVERGEWRDDFAWAREQSFAMCSDDVDWLLWLDDDDLLAGAANLRPLAQQATPTSTGSCSCTTTRATSKATASASCGGNG
jgi:hypothetical protein